MKSRKAELKRRLTLALALAMIIALFAVGCGAPVGDNPDNSAATPFGCTIPGNEGAEPGRVLDQEQLEERTSDQPEISPLPETSDAVDPANSSEPISDNSTEPPIGSNTPDESTILVEDSSFAIHFIDVGQADAALVLCDGRSMLIDGGNAEDSNLIYAYLKKLSLDHLDYIVCTHAHEDHVGGLSGALNYAAVDVALAPVTSYDSKAFGNYVSYLTKQNVSITVPTAGQSFSLGSALVSILGPITNTSSTNNTSIVLRIVYGETSFLFTGDAEREEEQSILNAGYDLNSTVLKVGHHGSDTSTSYVWLREIMPKYAVISVGKGNSYGHPTEAVLSRLRDAEVKTYRTDMQGDVICTSDGKMVTFSVGRNADADTLIDAGAGSKGGSVQGGNSGEEVSGRDGTSFSQPQPVASAAPTPTLETVAPLIVGTDYILNTNTYKFHYPTCGSVNQMSEKNKWIYNGDRNDVIEMGYVACKKCNP